jgi:glutathione S-transferase
VAGRAREKYGIKAPSVTGHENFERAYRVQMNTVEQMVFFLPALWLCAVLLPTRAQRSAD